MSHSSTLATLDHELNQALLSGDIMGAFEKYYADEIQMQENSEPPCIGKAANRIREQAFVDSVKEVHAIELLGSAVGNGVTYSEWMMDITFKDSSRVKSLQASARRWKHGKVVSERFYYNKG